MLCFWDFDRLSYFHVIFLEFDGFSYFDLVKYYFVQDVPWLSDFNVVLAALLATGKLGLGRHLAYRGVCAVCAPTLWLDAM